MSREQTFAHLRSSSVQIQNFGVLLVPDRCLDKVVWCSANSEELLGIPSDEALQLSLQEIIGPAAVHDIGNALSLSTALLQREQAGSTVLKEQRFTLWVHLRDGWPLVELEPQASFERPPAPTFDQLHSLLTRLERVEGLDRCLGDAVIGLRHFTGFERVMVCRLESDDCGAVIAEARGPELTSLLGSHIPMAEHSASRQGHGPYSGLRIIGSLCEPEIPLVTPKPDVKPPALALALLRSVSSTDRAHLRSIGVSALMSFRLSVRSRLWGTVEFHHGTSRTVDPDVRAAVEIVLKFLALEIARRSDSLE